MARSLGYTRYGTYPATVRIAVNVNTTDDSAFRALGVWLWEHPGVAPEVIRRGLEQLRAAGILDSLARAVEGENG